LRTDIEKEKETVEIIDEDKERGKTQKERKILK
jgi:hypothetical protein